MVVGLDNVNSLRKLNHVKSRFGDGLSVIILT